MNFSIEVAAEANPLKPDTLHNILRSASSSDPQQVRTSALQLQGWETERGYYGLLQVLISTVLLRTSLFAHYTLV